MLNGMGLDTQYVGGLASSWVAGKLVYLQEQNWRAVWPWGGGIQLPLLWSLRVDKLVRGLKNGCCTLEYADDIVI
jgi:hypothetical protein